MLGMKENLEAGGFFSDHKNLLIVIGFGILVLLILILIIAAVRSSKKKNESTAVKSEELWHDRKRWLGLPVTMTRYWIDQDRLYVKTGFFNREINELLLYRILDIRSSRKFGQILCGVGTIILYSADQSNRTLKLENIKKPTKVHRFLSAVVERERVEHGIAGRELTGSASFDMDHMDGDCATGEHELHGHEHNERPGMPDLGMPGGAPAGMPPMGPPPEPIRFEDFK